jgi:hypothetical protein
MPLRFQGAASVSAPRPRRLLEFRVRLHSQRFDRNDLFRPAVLDVFELFAFSRFASPGRLVSYGRLAPRLHQSGQTRPRTGPLTKSGSRPLGWAAVEAAQQAWRESNPWHDLYLDVSARSGNRNSAKQRSRARS